MRNVFRRNKNEAQLLQQQDQHFQEQQNLYTGAQPQGAEDETAFIAQQKERSDLIRWQQNLEPELIQFVHDIKGEVELEEGVWGVPEGFLPVANDRFIRRVVTLARPLLSKNLIMSNYTEDRILSNLKRVCRTVRLDLLHNREMYDIEKRNAEFVVGSFKEMIEASYYRSLNNGERRHLSTIGKRIETFSSSPPAPKKTLFGMGG